MRWIEMVNTAYELDAFVNTSLDLPVGQPNTFSRCTVPFAAVPGLQIRFDFESQLHMQRP